MKRKKVSLSEGVLVMAVISLVAMILAPGIAQEKKVSLNDIALYKIKQLSLSMEMYIQDYDTLYPYWSIHYFCKGGNHGAPRDSASFWTDATYPYTKAVSVYRDPTDVLRWNDYWSGCSDDSGANDLFGPTHPENYVSFGLNEWLTGGHKGNKLANDREPAKTVMLADSAPQLINAFPDPSGKSADLVVVGIAFSNDASNKLMWLKNQSAEQLIQKYGMDRLDNATRHHGGDLVAFADGHCVWIPWHKLTIGNLEPGSQSHQKSNLNAPKHAAPTS